MPERGGGRCKAADEGSVFGSFQQIARGIFRGVHEQAGRGKSRFEGARSGYRCALRTGVGVGDGCEVGPSELLAIDVASQEILHTGTIGSRRCAEDARD